MSRIICDKNTIDRFLQYIMPNPEEGCSLFEVFKSTLNQLNHIVPFTEWNKTMGGYYTKPNDVKIECLRLNGVSAFITVNPVNISLLRRSSNKLKRLGSGMGVSDSDIKCLRHLFIDIDPVRAKGHKEDSATHAERDAAITVRDAILAEYSLDFGVADGDCLWGCSGNGCYILVRLADLPNDERHKNMVHDILRDLAAKFDSDKVKIDTKTYNPARVCGIPGTRKCKGTPTAERPWRLGTIDVVGMPAFAEAK